MNTLLLTKRKKSLDKFYQEFNIQKKDLPASYIEIKSLPSRSFLFKQNQKANKLFFLLEGKVLIGKNLRLENEQVLSLIMQPTMLGLDSMNANDQYSVYAKTLTEVRYIEIGSRLFNLLYEKNKKLHDLIIQQLSSRLMHAEDKYVQLYSNLGFFGRLKSFLINAFTHFGEEKGNSIIIQMQITHKELAQYMHASRQSITTVMNLLRKEEIIEYNRSQIELHCMDKLMQWNIHTN